MIYVTVCFKLTLHLGHDGEVIFVGCHPPVSSKEKLSRGLIRLPASRIEMKTCSAVASFLWESL